MHLLHPCLDASWLVRRDTPLPLRAPGRAWASPPAGGKSAGGRFPGRPARGWAAGAALSSGPSGRPPCVMKDTLIYSFPKINCKFSIASRVRIFSWSSGPSGRPRPLLRGKSLWSLEGKKGFENRVQRVKIGENRRFEGMRVGGSRRCCFCPVRPAGPLPGWPAPAGPPSWGSVRPSWG